MPVVVGGSGLLVLFVASRPLPARGQAVDLALLARLLQPDFEPAAQQLLSTEDSILTMPYRRIINPNEKIYEGKSLACIGISLLVPNQI